jgi:hypothetical protein
MILTSDLLVLCNLKKGFQPRSNGCRDKDGETVRGEWKILRRWEKYFKELLSTEKEDEDEEKERERNGNDQEETRPGRRVIEEDKEVNIPTREEIEECIQKTKTNKGLGEDGITAKLIKCGEEAIIDAMHKLISMIWTTEELPQC